MSRYDRYTRQGLLGHSSLLVAFEAVLDLMYDPEGSGHFSKLDADAFVVLCAVLENLAVRGRADEAATAALVERFDGLLPRQSFSAIGTTAVTALRMLGRLFVHAELSMDALQQAQLTFQCRHVAVILLLHSSTPSLAMDALQL